MMIRHFTFDHDNVQIDFYFTAVDIVRPYVRGYEDEGPKMPLRIARYEDLRSELHTKSPDP